MIAAGLILAGIVGYFAGRKHVAGAILGRRPMAETLWNRLVLDQEIAPGATAEGYRQLNAFLDRQLEERKGRAEAWRELLDGGDDIADSRSIQEIRQALLSKLQPWPGPRPDLAPVFHGSFGRLGVHGRVVSFTTHPDVRLTCVLLEPEGNSIKRPAVLALHGMYGGLDMVVDDLDYHKGFATDLARAGYVVLAPMRVDTTIDSRNTLYVKSMVLGQSIDSLDLWQLTRAVDFLEGLETVKPDKIAVVGMSVGGQHALWLGALDSRLSAVVSIGYFADRFSWLLERLDGNPSLPPSHGIADLIAPEDDVLFTREMDLELDDLNWIALIRPRHLALSVGRKDPRYRDAKARFPDVVRLYENVGSGERVAFLEHDGGHVVRVEPVLTFLESWRNSEPRGR